MDIVKKYIEGALVLIAIFLIVSNAPGFSLAVSSAGGVLNQSFKTLQGRG